MWEVLVNKRLKEESAVYPRRSFGEEDQKYMALIEKVKKRQEELKLQGRESVLLREDPFVNVKDGIDFQVHLMIWEKGIVNRKVVVESYEL